MRELSERASIYCGRFDTLAMMMAIEHEHWLNVPERKVTPMRAILGIILGPALLVACSSDPIDTEEECLEAGGHVIASPGGQVKCPEGEEEIGRIPAFEPTICCR